MTKDQLAIFTVVYKTHSYEICYRVHIVIHVCTCMCIPSPQSNDHCSYVWHIIASRTFSFSSYRKVYANSLIFANIHLQTCYDLLYMHVHKTGQYMATVTLSITKSMYMYTIQQETLTRFLIWRFGEIDKDPQIKNSLISITVCTPMALRIQIVKFKIRQYLLRANLPNLMFAKFSRYTVCSSKKKKIHFQKRYTRRYVYVL